MTTHQLLVEMEKEKSYVYKGASQDIAMRLRRRGFLAIDVKKDPSGKRKLGIPIRPFRYSLTTTGLELKDYYKDSGCTIEACTICHGVRSRRPKKGTDAI